MVVVTPSTIVIVKSIRSTILIAQEVAATRKSDKGGRGAMTRCPYHHHASYSSSSFNVSSSSLTAKSEENRISLVVVLVVVLVLNCGGKIMMILKTMRKTKTIIDALLGSGRLFFLRWRLFAFVLDQVFASSDDFHADDFVVNLHVSQQLLVIDDVTKDGVSSV